VAVSSRALVQVVDYAPAATFGPRRLRDYEFVWVLRGSASWTVDDGTDRAPKSARLVPGTLALSRLGTVDSYHWAADRKSTHAWVHFDLADPASLPDPASWPTTRSLVDNPVLSGLCDYLVDLGTRPSAAARRRTDELVALLLDLFVTGPLADDGPVLPPHVDAAVSHVRVRWENDGLCIVDVADLAAAARVSAGHLFRTFRSAYGCGPARALELVRLSRAAVALQRSNAPLAEVARHTGFANAYHLSRRFALTYGVPPGAYRRDRAGEDPYAPLGSAGLRHLARVLMT